MQRCRPSSYEVEEILHLYFQYSIRDALYSGSAGATRLTTSAFQYSIRDAEEERQLSGGFIRQGVPFNTLLEMRRLRRGASWRRGS